VAAISKWKWNLNPNPNPKPPLKRSTTWTTIPFPFVFQVKKTCGTPSLTPYSTGDAEARPPTHKNIKWATDPDPDMVIFLSTIDKSKEFYTTIVDK